MNHFRRLLAIYRDGVTPGFDSAARVRERLKASRAQADFCRGVLAPLAETSPDTAARVRRRLTTPAPRRGLPLLGGLGVAALTALVTFAILPSLVGPTPLAERLHADDVRQAALTPMVTLAYQGTGSVSGTDRAPAIDWESGALHVEVEPGRGIALSVHTSDADVTVIGTVFDVTRDVLGTRVDVTRGHVAVGCASGAKNDLLAGTSVVCLPTSSAGLLGRANALAERGDSADAVLATLELGLARSVEGPVRDELLALRVAALAQAGRVTEARAAADTLLANGPGLRHAAIARLAGRLALDTEGCAAALPYMNAIPVIERVAADDVALATCLPSAPSEQP